jgi:hypothetical protein
MITESILKELCKKTTSIMKNNIMQQIIPEKSSQNQEFFAADKILQHKNNARFSSATLVKNRKNPKNDGAQEKK